VKVLVVFSHPRRSSFCGAALDRLLQGLQDGGHETRLRDLYAINFNGVLSAKELERERKDGRATAIPAEVAVEQSHVLWADAVAFVCPLWWSDVPAILKGWFDRVWTKGFAWSYDGDTKLRHRNPALGLLLVSAGASSEKLEHDGIVAALRAVVIGDRLLNVGFQSARLVLLAGLDTAGVEQQLALLEQAYRIGRSAALE
jgi:NAD(P)H dehydrogenase (quinone)